MMSGSCQCHQDRQGIQLEDVVEAGVIQMPPGPPVGSSRRSRGHPDATRTARVIKQRGSPTHTGAEPTVCIA